MKRSNIELVHGFGTAVATLGSLGVGACTVALIAALLRSGNICAALGVGIFLSAMLVYAGDWCQKLAALNEIAALGKGAGGGNGDD